MIDHDEAIPRISRAFGKKGFRVQTRLNNLPIHAGRLNAIYRPDILVRSLDDQIVWIVEVETSGAGKAVADKNTYLAPKPRRILLTSSQ